MKKIINNISVMMLAISVLATSCTLDFVNPNAASEDQVLSTKDGLFALAIGIKQEYSIRGVNSNYLTPSVTTRETAIMTTFANLEELENGGSALSGENGYTQRLFSRNHKVKGMTEELLAAVDGAGLTAGTASGLIAYGSLFRAMTLGNLAQNFEQVAIDNSRSNDAAFYPRMEAYQEAIDVLQVAISGLTANPASDEFNTFFGSDIDLMNAMNAYLARYALAAGQYPLAITSADKVDMASTSVYRYDTQNQNPVYSEMIFNVYFAPRVDFGLPAGLEPDAADERVAFHMTGAATGSIVNNLPVMTINTPFFSALDADIPLYLPGEMSLIKAEAYARTSDLTNAIASLDMVLTKVAADDAFGIGANLPAYSGAATETAVLDAIFQNRRIELFLIGTSLDDSRRLRGGTPPAGVDYTTERNRDFYPYSENERLNNDNVPNNPSI